MDYNCAMRNLVVNETWPSFTSTPSQTGSICSDAACLQLQEVMFLFGSGRSDHEMICHDLSYLSLLQPHLPRLPWCFVRKLDKGVLHLVGRAMAGGQWDLWQNSWPVHLAATEPSWQSTQLFTQWTLSHLYTDQSRNFSHCLKHAQTANFCLWAYVFSAKEGYL